MSKISNAIAVLLSVFLFSCGGSKDVDKLGDAQFCFDHLGSSATVSEVNACVAMVDGQTSAGAEGIRCSGGFIREGFSNAQKYVDAFKQIESGTGGSNMRTMMGLLTFTSGNNLTTDFANVDATFTSCYNSGGKGSTLLASFAYFSMSLIKFFNAKNSSSCSGTPSGTPPTYDLDACFTSFSSSNPADLIQLTQASSSDAAVIAVQSGIGAVIATTYRLSCSGTGANADLCGVLRTSVNAGGSDTRAIAVNFFQNVLTP